MQRNTLFMLAGLCLAASICRGQAVVGRPCLFSDYFAEWRTFPSILRDGDGNLTCGRHRLNNGGATQAPPAAGDPAATAIRRTERFGPQGHFTYRDAEGRIQDLWFDRYREKDRWHADQLNEGGATWAPAADGDPSGALFRDVFHVAYRDRAGGIQDLWSERGWRSRRLNLDGATGAPSAAGDPVQLVEGRTRHVLYRDGDGAIHDLAWDGAWRWSRVDLEGYGLPGSGLPGRTAAPAAAGDPAAVQTDRAWHIAYRDREGGIQDLWFDGAWHGRRLNAGGATDAPPALGGPCARVVEGRTLHVTYRDLGGNLQDLWFDGAWHARRLNAGGATDAPPAASDPVCMVPPSNWEYVAYVDEAGDAQLLTHFQDEPWRAIRLNDPGLRFIGGAFVQH
jgi:hypothetical protein